VADACEKTICFDALIRLIAWSIQIQIQIRIRIVASADDGSCAGFPWILLFSWKTGSVQMAPCTDESGWMNEGMHEWELRLVWPRVSCPNEAGVAFPPCSGFAFVWIADHVPLILGVLPWLSHPALLTAHIYLLLDPCHGFHHRFGQRSIICCRKILLDILFHLAAPFRESVVA
jgi:hypothetical protein